MESHSQRAAERQAPRSRSPLRRLPRRWLRPSLRDRVVVLVAAVLAVAHATAYVVVGAFSADIVNERVRADLDVTERLFERQLQFHRERLAAAARMLAADPRFRDAVGGRRVEPVAAALRSHAARIKTDLILLSDADGDPIASTASMPAGLSDALPIANLIAAARRDGSSSDILVQGGQAYLLVTVPLLAPLPIAWVSTGYAIDDALALDLKNLTQLEITFLSRPAGGAWSVLASTLTPDARRPLLRLDGTRDPVFDIDGQTFSARVRSLDRAGDGGEFVAVVMRPLAALTAPFDRLRHVLALGTLLSVIVSGVAGYALALTLTRPLAELTRSARRMRGGRYDEAIHISRSDEIGELADSLNHMRSAIAEREREILRLAYEDPLTGLPNRNGFTAGLRASLNPPSAGTPISILVLNVDRFRLINEVLDHHVGDDVLREVARRLRLAAPHDALLGRLGGDRFALMAPDGSAVADTRLIQRVTDAFRAPVLAGDQPVDVSLSIGLAHHPSDGDDAVGLVRNAEIACHAAKRQRRAVAHFDARTMHAKQAHLTLLGELRRALQEDELRLVYQPKLAVRSGDCVGVEALIRWQHPVRGELSPIEFIPFAEDTGYVRHLTQWVLEAGLRQLGEWHAQGHRLSLSLNLSTRDLLDERLPQRVAALLERHRVAASDLVLELTESALMENPDAAGSILQRLHELGVRLSIDDFGTGYSSLAYVRNLPVDELKIDRSFVRHVAGNAVDAAIVRSSIELAHSLGLEVTAEGVEDAASLALLTELGCDRAQGFHLSRPLPLAQFQEWLAARPRPRAIA